MKLSIFLIVASCLLLVAVIVLARNRWIQRHPLRACVVLSVIAHVLLVIGIYATNILRMPPLPPGDGAIMVRIEPLKPALAAAPAAVARPADALEAEPPVETTETQEEAAEQPRPRPDERPEPNATETDEAATVEGPGPPPESPATEPDVAEPAAPVPPPLADPWPADEGVKSIQPSPPTAEPANELPPVPPSSSASGAALPPVPAAEADGQWERDPQPEVQPATLPGRHRPYAGRSVEGRARETVLRGGSAKTEAAVQAALEWLASVQASDGRWDASLHGSGRGGLIEDQLRGRTGMQADTGITALALLAFLAHGETHQEGRHADSIGHALRFLASRQRANGDLGGDADIHARMYCHGMATLAFAEAYAMTDDADLRGPLQRAITYSLNCQDRYGGGWRYRPGEQGDTSQFGWQVMALTSASRAGVQEAEGAVQGMRRFLRSVSSGSAGGLASYRPESPPTRSMTAEALVCRWCLGKVDEATLHEASSYLMQQPPGSGPRNFYYWYYASLALCQLDAPAWPDWNRALQRELLKTQRKRGKLQGSWDPSTQWGPCGGRVYTTAIGALCFEVYYRYAPRADDFAGRRPAAARR